MDTNNNDDELKELYTRFKNELTSHSSDMYYNEDDLVMIYDVASDYDDTLVELEVLMLGRRLYPDSEDLAIRQGFFLLATSAKPSIDEYLSINTARSGILWDILRCRAQNFSLEYTDISDDLDELVTQHQFNDDESIIQFVKLVTSTLNEGWLATNYDIFISRCSYRDTAISECADALRYTHPDIAMKLAEELTSIIPFETTAWLKLAEIYRDNNMIADGLNAIEYAKAISPDDTMTSFVEATLLSYSDDTIDTAIRQLQQIIRDNPDMLIAKVKLSDIYEQHNRSDLAEMVWREELKRDPDSSFARERLNMINSNGEGADSAPFELSQYNEDELAQYIRELAENKIETSLGILSMLTAYDNDKGIYKLAGDYLKLLYRHNRLQEICEFMERERPADSIELRLDPPALPLYAAAQLRLGRYSAAATTAREYMVKADLVSTNTELSMAFAGVKIVLNYILNQALQANYSIDRDPLTEAL